MNPDFDTQNIDDNKSLLKHESDKENSDPNVKSGIKFIPAISIKHNRVVVVEDGMYQYLRTDDGQFRSPVNVVQELQGDEIFVLDIDGLERSSPNLSTIKKIAAYKDVWLDAGAQDVEDMMDLFVNDAEYAVIGTRSIRSLNELERAAEISDKIIFSIDYDEKIISSDENMSRMTINQIAETVSKFRGLDTVILMDLGSHLNKSPVDMNLIIGLTKVFENVYVSAHVVPDYYPSLEDAGVTGIISDFRTLGGAEHE